MYGLSMSALLCLLQNTVSQHPPHLFAIFPPLSSTPQKKRMPRSMILSIEIYPHGERLIAEELFRLFYDGAFLASLISCKCRTAYPSILFTQARQSHLSYLVPFFLKTMKTPFTHTNTKTRQTHQFSPHIEYISYMEYIIHPDPDLPRSNHSTTKKTHTLFPKTIEL